MQRKKQGYRLLCAVTIIALLFTGCAAEVVDGKWVKERMAALTNEGGTVVFYPNPMYEYAVEMNEEFLSLFGFEEWVYQETMPSVGENGFMMLYCDLSDEEGVVRCRMALFSDDRVLVQEYKDGVLSDAQEHKRWYCCSTYPNGTAFADVTNWIDENVVMVSA